MARPFSDYTGQFFWDFKRMDNVNYNFHIVELLYKAKKQNHDDSHFNKPIIILLSAIIECIFYDFLVRIKNRVTDPFPNMGSTVVFYFLGIKETDELKPLIEAIKTQNILHAGPPDSIYDDLELLRKIRNRTHIQNKYQSLAPDEYRVYTDANLELAERCFERVCEVFCNVYPRWNKQPLPMSEFPRPWL